MIIAPQCKGSDQRGGFDRKGVTRRDVLRAIRCEGKSIVEAVQAIPRRLAPVRGVAILGHGSCLPCDQAVDAFTGNQSFATYLEGMQNLVIDKLVQFGEPDTEGLTGFLTGIG